MPRCGSTYLVRSLAGLPPGGNLPNTPDSAFVRDLAHLPNVRFLKTHSLAPRSLPEDVRAVFLFGDPVKAVMSTRNRRYDQNHFANCGYTAAQPPEILERDDLGYERIFDSWMAPHRYPVLALRYETLFENQQAVSAFLGVSVRLLPLKPRTTVVPAELQGQLRATYASLIAKCEVAPDVRLVPVDRSSESRG